MNIEVCCTSESEEDEERRELRKRKASLSVHKRSTEILSLYNWSKWNF